jgi:SAM-dependent methyltransferase
VIPVAKFFESLRRDGIGKTKNKVLRYTSESFTKNVAENEGYCHCCRSDTKFVSKHTWLRDNYRCVKCYSIPRQRHIQYILDKSFSGWEASKIHESSPSNNFISRYCKSYSVSQFFSDLKYGDEKNGVRCESLECLTFADETFDFFITQDVFEHIFNPDIAAKEIMRVLKPGGIHIFTAPKHKGTKKSYPRARLVDGSVQHLLEENYHDNPIGDGRSLVTWDYGDDFEYLLFKWTNCPVTSYLTRDRSLGIDGEYLDVFVVAKPNAD